MLLPPLFLSAAIISPELLGTLVLPSPLPTLPNVLHGNQLHGNKVLFLPSAALLSSKPSSSCQLQASQFFPISPEVPLFPGMSPASPEAALATKSGSCSATPLVTACSPLAASPDSSRPCSEELGNKYSRPPLVSLCLLSFYPDGR